MSQHGYGSSANSPHDGLGSPEGKAEACAEDSGVEAIVRKWSRPLLGQSLDHRAPCGIGCTLIGTSGHLPFAASSRESQPVPRQVFGRDCLEVWVQNLSANTGLPSLWVLHRKLKGSVCQEAVQASSCCRKYASKGADWYSQDLLAALIHILAKPAVKDEIEVATSVCGAKE